LAIRTSFNNTGSGWICCRGIISSITTKTTNTTITIICAAVIIPIPIPITITILPWKERTLFFTQLF